MRFIFTEVAYAVKINSLIFDDNLTDILICSEIFWMIPDKIYQNFKLAHEHRNLT